MKVYLTILLWCISLGLKSQNVEKLNKKIERRWFGTIVLNSGEEITCYFIYNPLLPEGTLLVKTDSTTLVYGVTNVIKFSFFDEESKKTRHFYSFPVVHKQGAARRKYFLELLHETNQISILTMNMMRAKDGNAKLLLDHRDNTIYRLSKRELLRMTEDYNYEIIYFIKMRNLDMHEVNDVIDIIDYYCELKNKT